jgi:hypothetical protein
LKSSVVTVARAPRRVKAEGFNVPISEKKATSHNKIAELFFSGAILFTKCRAVNLLYFRIFRLQAVFA